MDSYDVIRGVFEALDGWHVLDNVDDEVLAAHGDKQAFIIFGGVHYRPNYIKPQYVVEVITTIEGGERGIRDIAMEAIQALRGANLVVVGSSRLASDGTYLRHGITVREP